jgi:arylsulfatase A-like enzyme
MTLFDALGILHVNGVKVRRLAPCLAAVAVVFGYSIASDAESFGCDVAPTVSVSSIPLDSEGKISTASSISSFSPTLTTSLSPADTPILTDSSSPHKTASLSPNVILIIVDALRSDHVSAYGYDRETTPNLDGLVADQGVRFQDATTTAPWTCPAVAATMTGRNPSSLGVSWDTTANSIPEEENTLAEYLHHAGYYTVGFANNYCTQGRLGFDQGFDEYDDYLAYEHTTSNKARAGLVNSRVIEWLENTWTTDLSGTQPLFLFVYYFDPHTWYDPLPPYDTLYDPTYTGTLTAEVYQNGQDVVSGKIVPTTRDIEHLIALYDGEIAYWDYHLGRMLSYLEEIQLLNNALIVVTSDHGEMFGEHDQWVHGSSLYEEVLRVPLLIRYTGMISPGLVVTTSVQNMDIVPSILDWVGIELPDDLHAVSLRALVEGGTTHSGRDVFSEVDASPSADSPFWIAPPVALRSIRRDQWKLIHHLDCSDADELYRLRASSLYEADNLVSIEPDRARELRQDLLTWFGIHNVFLPCISARNWSGDTSSDVVRQR